MKTLWRACFAAAISSSHAANGSRVLSRGETYTPPPILYHYGRKALLMENIRVGNIPLAAWNTKIMGEETKWRLPPFRRGLYSCPMSGTSASFANTDEPWVMGIRIRASCRSVGKHAAVENLRSDPNFGDWLQKSKGLPFSSVADFLARCHMKPYHSTISISGYVKEPEGPAGDCGRTIQRYFSDRDIKIVFDINSAGCWYIRDRNCIEGIVGRPEEIPSILADCEPGAIATVVDWKGDDWRFPMDGYGASIRYQIFLEAMKESTTFDRRALESLERVTARGGCSSNADLELQISQLAGVLKECGTPSSDRREKIRAALQDVSIYVHGEHFTSDHPVSEKDFKARRWEWSPKLNRPLKSMEEVKKVVQAICSAPPSKIEESVSEVRGH